MGGNGKRRWIISFRRTPSRSSHDSKHQQLPKEFVCPISGSLMSEPVVVASGQTFERVSVQVCRELGFSPKLEDGTRPDFTTMIPNLAIKSTILKWCENAGLEHPRPPDYNSVETLIRASMEKSQEAFVERQLLKGVVDNPPVIFSHAATEVGPRVNHFDSGSSEESAIVTVCPPTPLPLKIRPSCYSSSSSSSDAVYTETQNPTYPISLEEEQVLTKLKSAEVFEQEEGVISLRNITKSKEETRASLCTPRLMSALRPLVISRYSVVQINAVASLVNLSLAKPNKVKIVRSGLVPPLVDILKGGYGESQEHAAGALFSLALDDDNKMTIGVLGALQPLMHALRSESERTRHDSALALYHLTLIQSNRVKLVKLRAVPTLLSLLKSRNLASRVLLVLYNLAVCPEGRIAMLDLNAVECLVDLLRSNELGSESAIENCVAALCALSHGSFRFKGLAREARAVEVLKEIEEKGSERAKVKAKRILQIMRAAGDDEDDRTDWNRLVDSGPTTTRARYQVGVGRNIVYGANPTTM